MKLPGLPQGQGAAAAGDPAGRPRGGGRAGAPRRRCPSGTSARCSTRAWPTIGDPKLDVGDLPGEGEALEFTIEVGVRPRAELGEWKGLEVGRADAEVPDDAVQAELDRLREGFASLAPVERPAAAGDAVVVDFSGTIDGEPFEGSESRDFVIELGAESLLPEFDAELTGAGAGDERTVEVTLPRRPPAREPRRARPRASRSRSRRCGRRTCPSSTTSSPPRRRSSRPLDELRDEIRSRMAEGLEQRAEAEFREAAVDAVAANAKLEIPHDLVHARAHEMWERIERQLASRGIDPQAYAQMQGKSRHDLIDDAEEDAERALRREAVLAAVADAEGIEPDRRGPGRGARPGGRQELAREAARPPARVGPRRTAARRGPDAQGGRRDRRGRRRRSRWSGPPPASRSGRPTRATRTTTGPSGDRREARRALDARLLSHRA